MNYFPNLTKYYEYEPNSSYFAAKLINRDTMRQIQERSRANYNTFDNLGSDAENRANLESNFKIWLSKLKSIQLNMSILGKVANFLQDKTIEKKSRQANQFQLKNHHSHLCHRFTKKTLIPHLQHLQKPKNRVMRHHMPLKQIDAQQKEQLKIYKQK